MVKPVRRWQSVPEMDLASFVRAGEQHREPFRDRQAVSTRNCWTALDMAAKL
jgi:hypothetical protein